MTYREMNLKVFQGRPIPHPLFQPRAEPWFHWHRIFGRLPEGMEKGGLRGFYDGLGLSMRYVQYYTDIPGPVVQEISPKVVTREREEANRRWVIYETPYGDLEKEEELTVDQTWRVVGFPVKDQEDLKGLRWLFDNMEYRFSSENFTQGDAFIGERGVPQFWVPKSPYQALAQQWMTLPNFIYALHDRPRVVKEVMEAIDRSYDRLYPEMITDGRPAIVNFGENIHEQLLSPRYFEEYLIPFWTARSGQLRKAGIFTHVHIDGYFHNLLPYLADLPFDGLEALTPKPQGDVSLEEIKEHIGDKVLLDGIPAVYFMESYQEEELMRTVETLVDLFHPRLVLGVSDEVPEGQGLHAVERLRRISNWCRQACAKDGSSTARQ